MPDTDSFAASAFDLLGSAGWTTDPDVMQPWLTDWRGRYEGRAIGLASPDTTGQLSALVALCARYRVPIVPQGGNSSMSGGATPDSTGRSLLLSLRRMNCIRDLDVPGQQVVCDAGVVLQELHEAAAQHRLRFPLTLGGKGSATVGGLIATNAGGTQVLRHGTMRAQVLGIEAVLADGSVLDLLPHLKKDNRGFDLKQLFIGSEGTLGIVTAARLRLLPEVQERVVVWAGLETPSAAARLLERAQSRCGEALEGFEILPDSCLSTVLAYLPDARRPISGEAPWHALLEFVNDNATSPSPFPMVTDLLEEALDAQIILDAAIAQNEAQAQSFWALRDNISPAERAAGPAMQHDISVPVERMAAFIEAAIPRIEKEFSGTRALAFGHLGDGNVHFHVQAPKGVQRAAWENREGKRISAAVHDLVTGWRGSISAEHGIGQMKLDELERLHDPAALKVMHAVKSALDPEGLLNPGKLVNPAANLAPPGTNA